MKTTCFALTIALATNCVPAISTVFAEDSVVGKSLSLGHDSVAEKAIRVALPLKTELNFADVPLKEALSEIGKKHGIDIQYDTMALRDAAIDPTAIPVSLQVKDISLRSALKLLLSQNQLTYIVQDEVLQITTKDKANTSLRTVIYDVQDLVSTLEDKRPDFDSLTDLLTSTIAAPTWSEVGGQGTVSNFGPASLVVSQTEEVHDEVANLFAALRKLQATMKAGKLDDATLKGWSESDRAFEKLLEKKVELQFTETPLKTALAEIAKQYGLEVALDVVALRDAAIDPSAVPVTLNAKGISLRSALNMILGQNNLTYVLQDEVLQITTKDKASTTLVTRLYPVIDLLADEKSGAAGADESGLDYDGLIDLVTTNVHPATWAEVGGPGVVEVFDKTGALVLSQTGDVHDETAELLSKLRTMRDTQKAAAVEEAAQPKKPETLVLKVYDLRASAPNAPAMTPQEVMEVVKGLVEPKSWTQPDVYIRGATGKLIVKQLPSVHRQVEKLLDELGAQVPNLNGGRMSRDRENYLRQRTGQRPLGGTPAGGGAF